MHWEAWGNVRAGGTGLCLLFAFACTATPRPYQLNTTLTPSTHTKFPIDAGVHAMDCTVCHGPQVLSDPSVADFQSFEEFSCINCHGGGDAGHADKAEMDAAHAGNADYRYESSACYACHPDGTATGMPSGVVYDSRSDVVVDAGLPNWSGTSITAVAVHTEILHMQMLHKSPQYDEAANSACANCHTNGGFTGGIFHASLSSLGLQQPTQCSDCHTESATISDLAASPIGFVGPVPSDPRTARDPSSGEMRHEAVAWSGGTPTGTALVSAACETCHLPPAHAGDTWARNLDGGTPAAYHASLGAQPSSCVDCHANTRPKAVLSLTSADDPAIPSGVAVHFDHNVPAASGDCVACHASHTDTWALAQFHAPDAGLPASCQACHEAERPTSNAGWTSATYQASPFDYGPNSLGKNHGDGLDCAACHSSTASWVGGSFPHGAGTPAATTCIVCHTSQRPDLVLGVAPAKTALGGFDHSTDGTGDCFECHQATVAAGAYVNYFNPATGTLPGGDWKDGGAMPSCIETGGFTISDPPASNTTTVQPADVGTCEPGSMLPHPTPTTGESCAQCHANGTGQGVAATGYDHANLPAGSCNACHEAGSSRLGTVWNGNAGDSRPISLASVVARGCGDSKTVSIPNHFYPVDCYECHNTPSGVGATSTGNTFQSNWSFPHDACNKMSPTTCTLCHGNKGDCGC